MEEFSPAHNEYDVDTLTIPASDIKGLTLASRFSFLRADTTRFPVLIGIYDDWNAISS